MVFVRPRSPVLLRLTVLCLLLLAWPVMAQPLELSDVAHEGELRFLAVRPDPDAYRYESRVEIGAESLASGVVHLSTCHHQLDPNAKIVITFNPQRVRTIEVASSEGVERAEVQGHRVELSNVKRGASVCINLSSRILDQLDEHTWRLYAGPLMRRYLDGYLPMQARLAFQWPAGLLRVAQTRPLAQPGVRIASGASGAQFDLVFAGRMSATLDLVRGSP